MSYYYLDADACKAARDAFRKAYEPDTIMLRSGSIEAAIMAYLEAVDAKTKVKAKTAISHSEATK